jgi:hypothetical protein
MAIIRQKYNRCWINYVLHSVSKLVQGKKRPVNERYANGGKILTRPKVLTQSSHLIQLLSHSAAGIFFVMLELTGEQ